MPKLIECVPNFSEGRRPEVIEAIADEEKAAARMAMITARAAQAEGKDFKKMLKEFS